ncbi:MAG: hypothetical protein H0Z33_16595 [Bacillaceae bacterium]|nr:hypothetical protein [Bacillaceae bacterium]
MKKISDYLDSSERDGRQVVKSPAVIGEVIAIENAHFRKGSKEKPYVSVYFHFNDDVEETPYCWNTSSEVITDQIRRLKDAGAFVDDEPVMALVGKRRTKAGLWYYTLLDPDDEAIPAGDE